MTRTTKDALVAAGLSLVIPGLGQLVYRAWAVGIFWLVMSALFWFSSRSWLWFMPHVLAAVSAYWGVQRTHTPRPNRAAPRRRSRRQ